MKRLLFLVITVIVFVTSKLLGQNYITITGKITDSESNTGIELVHVYSSKFKLGSISNSEGRFVIKLPLAAELDSVCFSHIAYGVKSIAVPDSNNSYLDVKLDRIPHVMAEAVVGGLTVERILENLIKNIPDNYDQVPTILRAFYKEERIDKTDPYIRMDGISHKEAILDIYKHPYKESWEKRSLKNEGRIVAWRNSKTQSDSFNMSLHGFTISSFINTDKLQGTRSNFINDKEKRQQYIFKLNGIIPYSSGKAYVIEFDQKDEIQKQLNKGRLFIDKESFALIFYEEYFSPKGSKYRKKFKIMFYTLETKKSYRKAYYNKINDDKWHLYYLENMFEWDMEVFKKGIAKKLFKEEFKSTDIIYWTTNLKQQMIITDYNNKEVSEFKKNEKFKMMDLITDEIKKDDYDVWKDYNMICPNEIE